MALREAALASVRLLAGATRTSRRRGLPPRRAVLVADVDGATARPDLDDAVVRLSGPIAIDDAIAAYVDNAAPNPPCWPRSTPSTPPIWGTRTPN